MTPAYEWSLEESKVDARAQGCEVIDGTPTTLLLDLDSAQDLSQYGSLMQTCAERLGLKELSRWNSKCKGMHVVVECSAMSARERVMLQAVLGSDRKRAVLGLMMIQDGIEEPNCLFKPKVKV